jgi:hypothetical protein
MFLLSLFGNHRVYSNKKLAEQNASNWLRKFVIDNHWLWNEGITAQYRMLFERCFQREDYAGCVSIWNEYATPKDFDQRVTITEMQVDEKFT